MKLLVIVLCVLSERFLVQVKAHHRFYWFAAYCKTVQAYCPSLPAMSMAWAYLLFIVLPPILFVGIVFYWIGHFLFGLLAFILSAGIFYYCLGPNNTFYPARSPADESNAPAIADYLVQANSQLFAVIFWYALLGPIAVLAYRLVSLLCLDNEVKGAAIPLRECLDWIPVRMTAMLYLFVGNFHRGFVSFSSHFFSMPRYNQALLSETGLLALKMDDEIEEKLSQAQQLVEYALIVLLALLAIGIILPIYPFVS